MKKTRFSYTSSIILAAFFSFLLISCNEDNTTQNGSGNPFVDTSTFVYPITIGSTWNYTRMFNIYNIRPDSIRYHFTGLPVNGSGTIEIVYDTLINGIETRCFVDTYAEKNHVFRSRKYYLNTDSALIVIAYNLGSGSGILPKNQSKFYYKAGNNSYSSLYQLVNSIQLSPSGNCSDTLIIENPPPHTLKYPIKKDKLWIYRYFGSDTIFKKYSNFENVVVGGTNISCMKTQVYWSSIDFDSYDYYSKFGKLRSDFLAEDMIVTNEFGQPIGLIDVRDLYNVTSFQIADR
jgi:hypothetical protein